MTTHAKLSPSAAHRWLKCTASPLIESQYPNESSSYAQEGTLAHSLAEICAELAVGMISEDSYNEKLAELKKEPLYSPEMIEHCEEYAIYIKEKLFEFRKECPDAYCLLERCCL